MEEKEEALDQLPVPKNVEESVNILGLSFSMRRVVEGAIITAVLTGATYLILSNINMKATYKATIYLIVVISGMFTGIYGINGDSVMNYIKNVMLFSGSKKITYYNPHIKTKARYFTDTTSEDDSIILKERLETLYRQYMNKVDKTNATYNLAPREFDPETMFFEDDIENEGKPEVLMSKRELRKLNRERKKQARKAQKAERKARGGKR